MLNQEEYFSDSVRHAEGCTIVTVRSTDRWQARSSPTQRNYFVCNYCYAGARPLNNGAAWDFGKYGYNFSYTFNQDGSKSLSLGVNVNLAFQTFVYLEINMGLGLSMNSYSGTTLSTNGAVCIGEAGACGGIETGGSLYWDRGGSFMGATVYAGVYASLGEGMARVSAGYEAGLFGMEGRGLYAGANVGGVYAQVAQHGGWNYGFQEQMYLAYGNNTSKEGADGKTGSVVSAELWLPTLGKYGYFAFGETYDVSPEGVNKAQINQLKQLGFTDSEIKAAYGSRAGYEALQIKLVNMGFSVDHPYVDSDVHKGENGNPETKDTYSKNGEYGNIEFMIGFDNSYRYSSYNYGNNIFSHFIIDYVGYKGFINKW